jgi:hypothetical protein
MNRPGCFYILYALLLAAGIGCIRSIAQTPTKDLKPEEIIKAFSAKETELFEAWKQYAFCQTADIEVISVNGNPRREKMRLITDAVISDRGGRAMRLRSRAGALRSVVYTVEDEEIIVNFQPFILTEKGLPHFNLKYQGKEKVDELSCYVFLVDPKHFQKNSAYFKGKIWVDDRDLFIVRTLGRIAQQKDKNKYPEFEMVRQMIDGKYWFPAWVHANEHLLLGSTVVHIEETITYENYTKAASQTTAQSGSISK